MKILMVNKFLYPRGGAETYMLRLGSALEKCGHEVQYFGMYDEKNTVSNSENLYTYNMDFHKKSLSNIIYPFKIVYNFEAKRKITKVIKAFKPDVIHLNNINFQLTPSIIDAAYKMKVPVIWTLHDYQTICPNHLLYNPVTKSACEKCVNGNKMKCVKYRCIHSSLIKSIIGTAEAWVYGVRKTYKKVSRVICPSYFLRDMLNKGTDKFENKTEVIHNYTEIPEIPSKNTDEEYVVFVGRISYEKGIKVIGEAAKLIPDIKFKIVGSGPDEDMITGIENIEMTGFLTGDVLKRTIRNAKVLILPSVCYENCPLTILEAHSLGVPVITAGYGGMAELVEDGKTGALVKEMTPENLAFKIAEVLNDKEKLSEMEGNCVKEIEKMITLDKYTKRVEQIYKECIEEMR